METIIVAEPSSPKESATTAHANARCLSVHAGYRCRQAGACCTAGWHIPAEPQVVAAIARRFRSVPNETLFEAPASQSAPAILARAADGACVFFDPAGGRACAIHRDIGEPALPSACRHFPRVALRDGRGIRITLSHFCPTAAGLLFDDAPLRIVPAPDRLSLSGTIEGLDATDALPPLLRPGMLMDFDGCEAWERNAIGMLDAGGANVDAALAAVGRAAREIQGWSPGGEPLAGCIARVAGRVSYDPVDRDEDGDARRHASAVRSVPAGLTIPDAAVLPPGLSPEVDVPWREFDRVIRRYLATKLFAGWWPYLGLDLSGVVEALEVHAVMLRTCLRGRLVRHDTARDAVFHAIRDTDLLMVHLSDSRALARLIARHP